MERPDLLTQTRPAVDLAGTAEADGLFKRLLPVDLGRRVGHPAAPVPMETGAVLRCGGAGAW